MSINTQPLHARTVSGSTHAWTGTARAAIGNWPDPMRGRIGNWPDAMSPAVQAVRR